MPSPLECGDGPPVLLIPGDGAVAAAWAPLVAELPGYRTIVLDRPCFGLSERFDYRGCDLRPHGVALLRSLLDALELDAAAIIGSSGGAQWSLPAACPATGARSRRSSGDRCARAAGRVQARSSPTTSWPGSRRLRCWCGVARSLSAIRGSPNGRPR